jgi:hypothetical protein
LSDGALGLLTGTAFGIFFAICGIPLGCPGFVLALLMLVSVNDPNPQRHQRAASSTESMLAVIANFAKD